ncbi:pyridoxamine 5'-phosphate oxidase family protein [Ihubacter sp. rT4E-8]|uniref:pyridoxamine 5'-phosphate oxidase family protein n=1 Tax=unclassified Ihubacter TaxID=2633299 RepID=UPI00137B8E7B
MERIMTFLQEARPFFVATVDDDKPRVRPQGFVMEYDGKICFCTGSEKQTSKELKANPNLEIAAGKGSELIRIRGKAMFLDDESALKAAIDIMPALEGMMKPGKLEIFCFESGTAVIANLAGGQPETIEF